MRAESNSLCCPDGSSRSQVVQRTKCSCCTVHFNGFKTFLCGQWRSLFPSNLPNWNLYPHLESIKTLLTNTIRTAEETFSVNAKISPATLVCFASGISGQQRSIGVCKIKARPASETFVVEAFVYLYSGDPHIEGTLVRGKLTVLSYYVKLKCSAIIGSYNIPGKASVKRAHIYK